MIRILIVFWLLLFTLTSSAFSDLPIFRNAHLAKKQKASTTNLFLLNDLEETTGRKVGFISLSDIYTLSEHPDSLAIPSLKNIKDKRELQYFTLNEAYKKRLFVKAKISAVDSIFVYDYATNVLLSFAVKSLNVSAKLSDYRTINEQPLSQYDYEIGFEINKAFLQKLSKYYAHVLVYVGKENQFVRNQMKPIPWKKITPKEFPLANNLEQKRSFPTENLRKGNRYLYVSKAYHYFVQDFTTIKNSKVVVERHLLVMNKANGKMVLQRTFRNHESGSITPLNFGIDNPEYSSLMEQWTGKLLTNKPEVVFGFEWISFGCPNIIFLNSKMEDIFINCDNRH